MRKPVRRMEEDMMEGLFLMHCLMSESREMRRYKWGSAGREGGKKREEE